MSLERGFCRNLDKALKTSATRTPCGFGTSNTRLRAGMRSRRDGTGGYVAGSCNNAGLIDGARHVEGWNGKAVLNLRKGGHVLRTGWRLGTVSRSTVSHR